MFGGDAQLAEVPAPSSLARGGEEDLDDRALDVEPPFLETVQHEATRPAQVTEQRQIEELARLAAGGELRGEGVLGLEELRPSRNRSSTLPRASSGSCPRRVSSMHS